MPHQQFPFTRWRHRAVFGALLAVIFGFYLWTVGQGRIVPPPSKDELYPPLTDGFVAGQLSLSTEPRPELLALVDPYDAANNGAFRLHDASLYKGKYYIYFGPTPVLLLFLPFRVLGMGNLPEGWAVAIFMFASVLCSLLALSLVRRIYFPQLHRVPYTTVLMLGFGGAIPFFLRRPAVYEVAIACGSFCLMAAICCLLSLTSDRAASWRRAAAASLLMGLAVGARPTVLLVTPVLALVAWWLWRGGQRSIAVYAALFAPLAIVGVLLGLYNYARFDSWTEFGWRYQLAGSNVSQMVYNVRRIPFFAYLYLLQPAHVNMAFPYVHDTRLDMDMGVTIEPITGAFALTPILYVLLLLPVLRSLDRPASEPRAPHIVTGAAWVWTLVAMGLVQVLFLSTFPGVTMRYLVDFAPLLMTAAGIVIMGIEVHLQRQSRWRPWAHLGLALLVFWSIFLNVSLGIRGYYNNLKVANPAVYDALKRSVDGAIDAVVAPFFSRDLQLLSVISPVVEQRVSQPVFWLSAANSELEVFARREGDLVFRTALSMHPELPSIRDARLTITGPKGDVQTRTVANGESTFVIPLQRGHNTMVFTIDYDRRRAPPGEPPVMRLAGLGWTLSPKE